MTKISSCDAVLCAFVPGQLKKKAAENQILNRFEINDVGRYQFLGATLVTLICGVGILTSGNWHLTTRLLLGAGTAGGLYLMKNTETPLRKLAISIYQAANTDRSQFAGTSYT